MCNPINIIDTILISKNDILLKYSQMNQYFIDCIKVIYGESITSVILFNYKASSIIEELEKNKAKKGSGDYTLLDKMKHHTGIYLFLENNIPVYIGKAGTGKNDDLKDRVKKECKIFGETKDESGTLSKNIKEIESYLGNANKVDSFEKIRNIIRTYDIITISNGLMLEDKGIRNLENIDKTNALETILIALFHPKYNK